MRIDSWSTLLMARRLKALHNQTILQLQLQVILESPFAAVLQAMETYFSQMERQAPMNIVVMYNMTIDLMS